MKKASSAETKFGGSPQAPTVPGGHSLWLWVAAGFLFLALLWTGMFVAARRADSRTVPLATQGGRP